jgi:hypothetical protein
MRKKLEIKKYPDEVIDHFTRHVFRDTASFNWLMNNGYKELVATLDAIRDDRKAFYFLFNSKHVILAAFVNAIWDDDAALQFLLDNKAFEWAACANIINGDDKAEEFLKRIKKDHYILLAHAIQSRIHEDGDRATTPVGILRSMFDFKKIFKKNEDS